MSIKHYLPEERLEVVDSLPKNEIDTEGFSKVIEELLGDEEVRCNVFGNLVRRYQKANEWPRLGSKAFLDAFGIPSNTGLVNAIFSIMGDRVTLIGDDKVTGKIKLNAKKTALKPESTSTSPEPELVMQLEEHLEVADALLKQPSPPSQYILIDGLNNSNGTFRLPRDPHHLGAALIWITENAHLYPTFPEVKEQLASETNLSKSRVHYLLTRIGIMMGRKDWLTTVTTSNMDAIVIFDALQTHVYQACLDKQIEVTEQYNEYFSQARNHISGNNEEE